MRDFLIYKQWITLIRLQQTMRKWVKILWNFTSSAFMKGLPNRCDM